MGKIMIILALTIGLCGCVAGSPGEASEPLTPVVISISIAQINAQPPTVMEFTTDRQTTAMLNYLRLLDIQGPAQVNPEQVAGVMYQFRLRYSDGSEKILMQKADRYFKGSDGIWTQIEPYSGSRLRRLLPET